MKFSHLYEELKLLDICKPVSPEESAKRDKEYSAIKFKDALDNVEKTKLPDGTWHVHARLDLSKMKLTTLENLNVSIVDGYFSCSDNKLTSLKGCPKTVGLAFYCYDNTLTSLEGCPKEVNGNFYCYNNKLTSLEGCPTEVNEGFYCNNNNLTSLEGCPKEVGRNFYCYNNTKKFTKDEVRILCDVKGKIVV